MLRRVLLVVLPAALASPQAAAQPKLGDSEWLRLFGAFLRELNQFVFSINDDRLDRPVGNEFARRGPTWRANGAGARSILSNS